MSQALKVFINYRRADTQDFVEKLFPWFFMRYGAGNVFVDYTSIPEFEKFEDFIRHKIRESDVIVSLIGPRWLEEIQARAARGEKDYVLIELEEALANGKIIAPICVNGATPPNAALLPATIQTIFDLNVGELRDAKSIVTERARLFERLEKMVFDTGQDRVVDTPEYDAVVAAQGRVGNLLDALRAYLAAEKDEDWATALTWIGEMRTLEGNIPDFFRFDIDEREAACVDAIQAEEDARQRHEVAAYLYEFVRLMHQFGYPQQEIDAGLQAVWAMSPDYDPDGIGWGDAGPPSIRVSTPAQIEIPPPPAILPAPFEWCYIPGGEVTLEAGGYVPEGGQTFSVEPFFIAKYCITNAQFEVFVQASDGYANMDWWGYSEAASKWRKENSLEATAYAGDDLPRTEVSWYEAMAFCQWLSAKTGENITLPTEQQWQFAAQGTDGRTYPWGEDAPTAELLNFNYNVGKPTPVDSYPLGASPFGVLNMAGNVWEWCITPWKTGDNQNISSSNSRVLRGGSFSSLRDRARCGSRNYNSPPYGSNSFGFRFVVACPPS